jgi:glycosyltransferase involved in cell wall biosynthesis
MKIAIVYDAIYPWVKGGGEIRIYELGKRLVSRGHDVHLFGVKWWNGSDVIEYEGMILHGVCKKMTLYVNDKRSIYEAIIFSINLISPLMEEKFDIIDVTSFPFFSCFSTKLVSMINGTKMVITWHEVWGDYWYKYLGKSGFFGKTVEYMVSRLGHMSITVSSMTANNLELLGVDSEEIRIIPNGVDLRRISNIKPFDIKCDMIFVGRLIKEKNIDILLKTVGLVRNKFPSIVCHIVGNGPEKGKLVDLVVEYGLISKVLFFNSMEHDEVIARIKSSKMLILPSSREGFGIVVMEAFACGIPVITVKEERNAASELVDEGTGIVIDLDAREMSNAINKLMDMTDETREKMSKSAIEKASAYDWEVIVGQLIDFYGKVILTK